MIKIPYNEFASLNDESHPDNLFAAGLARELKKKVGGRLRFKPIFFGDSFSAYRLQTKIDGMSLHVDVGGKACDVTVKNFRLTQPLMFTINAKCPHYGWHSATLNTFKDLALQVYADAALDDPTLIATLCREVEIPVRSLFLHEGEWLMVCNRQLMLHDLSCKSAEVAKRLKILAEIFRCLTSTRN